MLPFHHLVIWLLEIIPRVEAQVEEHIPSWSGMKSRHSLKVKAVYWQVLML